MIAGDPNDSGLSARSGQQQASKGEQQTERNERAPCPAWGTGPAVASGGQAVRVYDVDAAYPQFAWQIANDGSGWSSWRMPIGGSWGTMRSAAARLRGHGNHAGGPDGRDRHPTDARQ